MIDKSKIIINNNVIGNGFIANHFKDFKNYKTIIIFASGISNSKCKSERQFIREFNLLKKTYNQHTKKNQEQVYLLYLNDFIAFCRRVLNVSPLYSITYVNNMFEDLYKSN